MIMKTRIRLFLTVVVLSFVFAVSTAAQDKKDLLHMIENQNTTINTLNQQIGALMAHQEQLRAQITDLKKQVDELKTLVAASGEASLLNTGWTQRGDFCSGLALIQDDNTNKYGFIDKSGKVVIPCVWKSASHFNGFKLDNAAKVENANGLWGFIDKTGKEMIPCKWKSIDIWGFGEKLENAVEVENESGLKGFIDKSGKEIIPCKWKSIREFGDGFEGWAAVENTNGLWGFIDKTGKVVIPCNYRYVGSAENGKVSAQTKSGYYIYIDRAGREYNSAY